MLPIRKAARIVVLDAPGSIPLCRYEEQRGDELVSFWVPPGGAVEDGEDYRSAAIRELREETGLEVGLEVELGERRSRSR